MSHYGPSSSMCLEGGENTDVGEALVVSATIFLKYFF